MRQSILLSVRVDTTPSTGLISITLGSSSRKSRRRRRSSERIDCQPATRAISVFTTTKCRGGRFGSSPFGLVSCALGTSLQIPLQILAQSRGVNKSLQIACSFEFFILRAFVHFNARFGFELESIFLASQIIMSMTLHERKVQMNRESRKVNRKILSSSAKCPTSIILSASSRTKNFKFLISHANQSFYKTRIEYTQNGILGRGLTSSTTSHSRPGVATRTSTPRASIRRCFCEDIPPTRAATLTRG